MPAIPQYENKIEGVQLNDRASDARIRSGREISANYGSAAASFNRLGEEANETIKIAGHEVVKYEQAKEINSGAVAFMGEYARAQQEWEQRLKARPDDPTLQAKYMEDMEPRLQKFRDNFYTEGGQKWAESKIDALRQHLFTKTTAEVASVNASMVKVKVDQATNAASTFVANDPASVKFWLDQHSKDVDIFVNGAPGLTAAQAAQIKEQLKQQGAEKISVAAVQSLTMKNPAAGLAMAKDPELAKYIDGADLNRIAKYSEHLIKTEARAQREEKIRSENDDFHRRAFKLELETTRKDEDGIVQPYAPPDLREKIIELTNHPASGRQDGRLHVLLTRAQTLGRQLDEDSRVNTEKRSRTNMVDLYRRTHVGDDPSVPDRIVDMKEYEKAYISGDITFEAMQRLKADFIADKSEVGTPIASTRKEFLHGIEATIDPARSLAGLKSPAGSEALFRFSQFLRQREDEYRKSGGNPQKLYDPNSPDYVGNTKVTDRYKVSMDQIPASIAESLGGTGAKMPVLPGVLKDIPRERLEYNTRTQGWRDKATGKTYDKNGVETK